MLCDWCKKNEAAIHIQQITGSEKKLLHICHECAAGKFKFGAGIGFNPVELAELLYELISKKTEGKDHAAEPDSAAAEEIGRQLFPPCPCCGWTIDKLRETGRVGCPDCYRSFRTVIDGALADVNSRGHHIGKIPGAACSGSDGALRDSRWELAEALVRLNEAVAGEKFERAAVLRDRISILRKRIAGLEKSDSEKEAAVGHAGDEQLP